MDAHGMRMVQAAVRHGGQKLGPWKGPEIVFVDGIWGPGRAPEMVFADGFGGPWKVPRDGIC